MPGYILLEQDKELLPDKYMCSFCGYLLRDARQTPCGHFYCDACVSSLSIDGNLTCLQDGEMCPLSQVYPDNFVRREILSLVVRCTNIEAGCKWRGEVRHLTNHTAECPFQKVKCDRPDCDVVMLRKDLQDHLQNDCEYRTKPCDYCGEEVQLADMKKHQENDCMKYPIACPNCKTEGIARDMMRVHLDPLWGECPELEGPCPFSTLGCHAKEIMNKDRRAKHMKNSASNHLVLLQRDYLELKERVATQTVPQQLGNTMGHIEGSQDQLIKDLVLKVESLTQENAKVMEKLNKQSATLINLQRQASIASNIAAEMPPMNLPLKDQDTSEFLKNLVARVASSEARLAQLQVDQMDNNQITHQQTESIAEVRHQLEENATALQVMQTKVQAQETAQGISNLTMVELNSALSEHTLVTYDGVLVWKIDQVARRRNDAISGQETSFYSPPFYSKRHGYKMCARIYLNGDGMGRGNSISLFFVIMRGEYDALLRWPFRHKVTLMLLDQDNVEHVIDAFRPDPSSSSFQRPRAKMNIASGCPLFCPLTELPRHAYIKDDVMFIKVIVDTLDS